MGGGGGSNSVGFNPAGWGYSCKLLPSEVCIMMTEESKHSLLLLYRVYVLGYRWSHRAN